jgi:exodeoxyribonuclease VII large subunit
LLVEYLEPIGAGGLQIAFEQLKKRLAEEGLFETARKRLLPLLPRRIGVVTSPDGAAIRDILRVLRRRNEAVSVVIAPARVQGEGAGIEIAWALSALNSRTDVDVIIVGRGGGSTEDLWSFNEECVARSIFKSRLPVISAVGHESDFTIADMVADLRASTPSAAAELVAMARDQIAERLTTFTRRLATAVHYRVLELRRRASELDSSSVFDEVPLRLRDISQRFDDAAYSLEAGMTQSLRLRRERLQFLGSRLRDADVRRQMLQWSGKLALLNAGLHTAGRTNLDQCREKMAVIAGKLNALSPLGVLGRGYAIAFDRDGKVVRRADEVQRGDRVRVRVAEGEMDCVRD